MTIQNTTLKLIQSRLRNRDYKISYQEIRDAIALLDLTEDDLLLDENIAKVIEHLSGEKNEASSSLAFAPQSNITTKATEIDTFADNQIVDEPQLKPDQNTTGEIRLTGQDKLDFVQETAGKAGLQLAKIEIAEIAETAPSSFQSRRQAITSVLSCIRQYLDDEADFIASEFGKLEDVVTKSDRTVAAKVNTMLGGVSNSAQDFKSLEAKLSESFSRFNGKNI